MNNIVFKKSMVIGIIIIFVGAGFLPIISGKLFQNISETFEKIKLSDPRDELDQYQTQGSHGRGCGQGAVYYALGQSFKPTLNILTRVEIGFRFAEVEDVVSISIRDSPVGEDLTLTSKNIGPFDPEPGDPPTWINFDFSDLSVIPENSYYIYLNGTAYSSALSWGYKNQSVYLRGTAYYFANNGNWGPIPNEDFCFKTYGYNNDNHPPNISIIKPDRGLYFFNEKIRDYLLRFRIPLIIGRITIEVNATDNDSGIEKVEFYINGKYKDNDTSFPYEYNWTWSRPRLIHWFIIKVVAYDYAGNTATKRMLVRKIL